MWEKTKKKKLKSLPTEVPDEVPAYVPSDFQHPHANMDDIVALVAIIAAYQAFAIDSRIHVVRIATEDLKRVSQIDNALINGIFSCMNMAKCLLSGNSSADARKDYKNRFLSGPAPADQLSVPAYKNLTNGDQVLVGGKEFTIVREVGAGNFTVAYEYVCSTFITLRFTALLLCPLGSHVLQKNDQSISTDAIYCSRVKERDAPAGSKNPILRIVKMDFTDAVDFFRGYVGESIPYTLSKFSRFFSVTTWGYANHYHLFVRLLLLVSAAQFTFRLAY
jgi:hypothetical protein